MDVVGLTVTDDPVKMLPVPLDQVKTALGLFEDALRVVGLPEQTVAAVGATLTVGAPTVTVTVLVMSPQSVVPVCATTW